MGSRCTQADTRTGDPLVDPVLEQTVRGQRTTCHNQTSIACVGCGFHRRRRTVAYPRCTTRATDSTDSRQRTLPDTPGRPDGGKGDQHGLSTTTRTKGKGRKVGDFPIHTQKARAIGVCGSCLLGSRLGSGRGVGDLITLTSGQGFRKSLRGCVGPEVETRKTPSFHVSPRVESKPGERLVLCRDDRCRGCVGRHRSPETDPTGGRTHSTDREETTGRRLRDRRGLGQRRGAGRGSDKPKRRRAFPLV